MFTYIIFDSPIYYVVKCPKVMSNTFVADFVNGRQYALRVNLQVMT